GCVMSQRAVETARQNAECTGHVVDPVARQKFEANPSAVPLSDSLSDSEAPPNCLVTYRNGAKEYVSEDILSGKVLGLLFGSNSPICYGFVRGLAKIYKAVKKEASDPFEVVYVSADTSRREFWSSNGCSNMAQACDCQPGQSDKVQRCNPAGAKL
ncbi:Putative nucleoredoxin 2, partial [Durusdinium trenchii]